MPSRYQSALTAKHDTIAMLMKQPELIDYILSATSPVANPAMLRERLTAMLARGDTYFWSDTLVDLVTTAAKSLPTSECFSYYQMPSPCGFIWLERPVELPADTTSLPKVHCKDGELERIWLHAISWNPVEGRPELYVVTFWIRLRSTEFYRQFTSGSLFPYVSLKLEDGDSIDDLLRPYKDRLANNPDLPVEISVFFAMLLFLQQQLLETRTGYADRATQRRLSQAAGKAKLEDIGHTPIQVITLRRPQHTRIYDEDEDRKHVEWQCRWIVRGFWREQFYPSQQTHHRIWIHPFVKGPDSMPLKTSEKILAVVR